MTATPETPRSDLDGLVAFVTGGGGRLGGAMSRVLAERGASVIVADLDGPRAKREAQAILDCGLEAFAVQVDVAVEESVAAALDAGTTHFGALDVLVNNAAPTNLVAEDAPVAALDLATWDRMMRGILRGSLVCAQQAIPLLLSRGGGSIINIASIHAHAGDPELTAYPVAKAGLLGLTRAIATQYGETGIRCNTVTLGTFPTSSTPAHWRERKVAHQLLPREGLPADAANAVAFLASPASSFITGTDVCVDGGLLAHLSSSTDPATRLERLRAGDR
jgi:NAD(P)-dependent dehydrogenase (short-subunit alcohol dehydrogenase family)